MVGSSTNEVLNNKKSIRDVIKETLKAYSRVIFNRNNYSEEWKKEEEKNLPNDTYLIGSMKSLTDPHLIGQPTF